MSGRNTNTTRYLCSNTQKYVDFNSVIVSLFSFYRKPGRLLRRQRYLSGLFDLHTKPMYLCKWTVHSKWEMCSTKRRSSLFLISKVSHLFIYSHFYCLVMPKEACDSITLVCTRGSQCLQGRCQCSAGEIFYSGICRSPPIVSVGQTCGSGEKCPEKSSCTSKQICECDFEYKLDRGKCVPGTVYGNLCASSLLCLPV
jgi:hypothetical protein